MSQTPGSGDLIAFLIARLDEDERTARAAEESGGGDWWTAEEVLHRLTTDADGHSDAIHIARHDPARVLRDVKADRALLRRHTIGSLLSRGQYKGGYCEALDEVIQIRAARFSDHPDYRQEWAFDGV
jgi:hypothetical protein